MKTSIILFALIAAASTASTTTGRVNRDFTTSAMHSKPGVSAIESKGIPSFSNWRVWETVYQLYYLLHMMIFSVDTKEITILDAKARGHNYDKQGFGLLRLNTSMASLGHDSEQFDTAYKREVEALARRLHPQAKRAAVQPWIFRGGPGQEAVSMASTVHLDFHQNQTAWEEYVGSQMFEDKAFSDQMPEFADEVKKARAAGLRLRKILGFWKPVDMEGGVCDNPLVFMDAQTFRQEDQTTIQLHMPIIIKKERKGEDEAVARNQRVWFKGLSGGFRQHPGQKWYFFPEQRTDEVSVFTHFSADSFFANPHGSVRHPGCPEGSEERKSVETRVALFW